MIRTRLTAVAVAVAATALTAPAAAAPAAAAPATAPSGAATNPYCSTAAVRKLIAAEFAEIPWFVAWADVNLEVVVSGTGGSSASGSTIALSPHCAGYPAATGRYLALHEAAHLIDMWSLESRLPRPAPTGVDLTPDRETSGVIPVSVWRWGGAPVTVTEYGRTITVPRVEWFADCLVRVLTGGRVLGGYTDCTDRTVWSTVLSLAARSYRTDVVWQSGTGMVFAFDRARAVYIGSWPV